ncbi:MAG: S46 family peptidase, partial [Micropepsaceae bacterium]
MRRNLFIAGFLSTLGVSAALADEGMWTFDNFPSQIVEEKYGVRIDQTWLDHVRASAGRMANGCSSSLVSDDGLVFTNHHCVVGCVQNLSTPENDFVANGFFTRTRAEERQCPAYQIEYL